MALRWCKRLWSTLCRNTFSDDPSETYLPRCASIQFGSIAGPCMGGTRCLSRIDGKRQQNLFPSSSTTIAQVVMTTAFPNSFSHLVLVCSSLDGKHLSCFSHPGLDECTSSELGQTPNIVRPRVGHVLIVTSTDGTDNIDRSVIGKRPNSWLLIDLLHCGTSAKAVYSRYLE
jgi:hypothetical protein